jgi:hypothetical protein
MVQFGYTPHKKASLSLNDLFERYVMPAVRGLSQEPDESEGEPASAEPPEVLPGEEDAPAARQVEHFGHVLPIA